MLFDVISLTQEQLGKLSVVQMKMLRTAQQKKNELVRKAKKDMSIFRRIVMTAGMKHSSLLSDKKAELDEEVAYKCAIIADNLIYNMSLNEPSGGGDAGDSGGNEEAGYIVDYTLSYNERYVIVRDYYLAIADRDERMALYAADEVAKRYLSSYYGTLYNVLATYGR